MKVKAVFDDGFVYDAAVLDMTEKDILDKFLNGVRNVAALGLALSFPTTVAVPHTILNAYKNVLAVGLATNYTFPRIDKLKEAIARGPAPAGPPPAGAGKKDEKKDAKKEEPKKEKEEKKEEPAEEEELGLDLFG